MEAGTSPTAASAPTERSLLYVTPYFPPICRVGALRPLKFCRHLPAHGWRPRVLCDFHPGIELDGSLLEIVPAGIGVHRVYSRHGRLFDAANLPEPGERLQQRGPRPWMPNENRFPLGHHLFDVGHATREGARLLEAHPCDAILVNADPFASLMVGLRLAKRFRVPMVADLRDPWAWCELRRPLRPALQRALTDRLERRVIESAARVVLNTETVLREYAARYPEYAHKLSAIRNHADPALFDKPGDVRFDRFTVLYAGTLRRHVTGGMLLDVLEALRAKGIGPDRVQIAMPRAAARSLHRDAVARGLDDAIAAIPHSPYRQLGGVMAAADVLVSISHPGQQRLSAKIYDYLQSERPIIACTDVAEMRAMLDGVPGATVVGRADTAAFADRIAEAFAAGRHQSYPRKEIGDSATATRALARVLDHAVGDHSAGAR